MRTARLTPRQLEAREIIAEGRFYPTFVQEEDGWHARWKALGSENAWVDIYVREAAMTATSADAEDQQHETLHDAWMMALKSRTGLVVWDEAECARFAQELEDWSSPLEGDSAARSNLVFRFEPRGDQFFVTCTLPHGRAAFTALGQSTYVCGFLRDLVRVGDHLEVSLSRSTAEAFVSRDAQALRTAGYAVEGAVETVPVTLDAELFDAEKPSAKPASTLKLVVRVAGEPVSAAEIRFLLDQGSTLVFFRDRWIEVDRNILREALRVLEKMDGKPVSNPLVFALGLSRIGSFEISKLEAHGWLRGLVNELHAHGESISSPDDFTPIAGLKATLRDYQLRGVNWLSFMTRHRFGALLADDMGLGKTLQTLAWLLRNPDASPALVVAPLSLVLNWQHECQRFTPSLKVLVHQGESRHVLMCAFRKAAETAQLTITSYNLLVKDYALFSHVAWKSLIVDEAQMMKNPDTQAARAICALSPQNRIALTGTPIENSVEDVWSIENFLNPGFLGERASFTDRFVRPIARDPNAAAAKRLASALEPFVLRRLKSDPAISKELGDKRETKEYCELALDQRREYEQALAEFKVSEREQGDIFALITRLKLICDGAGKLVRLKELLETIFAAGESALVFTQYAKVGFNLQAELKDYFHADVPFLHGGLSAAQREREIASFNRSGPRVFILSLRAGGFGLNLTKATHVIHFDRWWNPAMESQATDRAYRIGQEKDVLVHPFITVGTLEEHIDDILTRKSEVAGNIITQAEWLEAAKLDEP